MFRVTPGGKTTVHYYRRKPKKAHCPICGKVLAGVPNLRPVHMRGLAKTQKRPERPYGGVLCPTCLARMIKDTVRALQL